MSGSVSFFDLMTQLTGYRRWILVLLAAAPLAVWVLGATLAQHRKQLYNRLMTVPVYVSVLPGLMMAWILAYSMLFTRQNIFADLDFLLFFGPVASMIACLMLLSHYTELDSVPGFDKLSGMMILAGLSFLILLVLSKLRIFMGFFTSFGSLVLIFGGVYFLMHLGWRRLVR